MPHLEQGKVAGGAPVTAGLLKYILADYHARSMEGYNRLCYSAFLGVDGDSDMILSRSGEFQSENQSVGTYFISAGEGLAKATHAALSATYDTPQGFKTMTATLIWNDQLQEWKVQTEARLVGRNELVAVLAK